MSSSPLVNGVTRVLGIVGHPIVQVRAPAVWSGLFRMHGPNMLCIPYHVLLDDLAAFYTGARAIRNLAGLIVTIPHKTATVGLVDNLTERARLVQSVNFIKIDGNCR